ncbi:MAG TPA: guanitoxin biosynthesis pre-guanitoxin forming N-methyltransferase GntF [Candidatus Saccharimonadales bacterium]|nr:guanitoxin biosynthesis pre-guanitoxin forming N-methyltransferase GntF [Candidatus Saccharimonadales bacterium]
MSKETATIPRYRPEESLTADQIYWLNNPDWHKHFSEFYYNEYYRPEADGTIPEDEQFTLSIFANTLRNANLPTDRELHALVIGPGVTFDDAALLVPYASTITLGEYSSGNRDELLKWQKEDPTANDWDPYFKQILEYEGKKATPAAIAERGSLLRQKIRAIVPLDATQTNPLGEENRGAFDIVIAPYCFESATDKVDTWRQMQRNGLSLAKPGALVLEAALSDCPYYIVGGRPYPGASINRTHIASEFGKANMTDTSVQVGYFPTHRDLGYDKVVVASGRMPIQSQVRQVPLLYPYARPIGA